MLTWLKNLLWSRAFWTGLGPVVVAAFKLFGRPLGDDKEQALTVLLSAIAGWVGVTAVRKAKGLPSSYKKAVR